MGCSDVDFDSGGLRCAATLYRPDAGSAPVACVVMGSGGTLTRKDGIPGYAQRFAGGGFAALAFDYRHWGDSAGEPRRWLSIGRQLEDWRAAVHCARRLEGVDPRRVALWGMSLGGGHALMTAAADPSVAATVALVPVADGLALLRKTVPPIASRMLPPALSGLRHRRVTLPVAGPSKSFALLAAPETLPGFTRLASASGWRNEVVVSGMGLLALARYRPVRRAHRIRTPVLMQLGEHDGAAPLLPIERAAARAPHAELIRYPIDHFECFWPEHIERVASDQLDFLHRHLS
jgi:pimeloyl-ACP methyl ester carboxylesterase